MGKLILPLIVKNTKHNKYNKDNIEDLVLGCQNTLTKWIKKNKELFISIQKVYPNVDKHVNYVGHDFKGLYPKIYSETISNHDVFIFNKKYIAIPTYVQQPYQLTEFILEKLPGQILADSLESLKSNINRQN